MHHISTSPMIEVKGQHDYHCSACRRWITPAHGGIRCRKCNHLYCCHFECIPKKYCEDPTYPGGVDTCQKCDGVLFPKKPPEGQEDTAKATIIQVHTVETSVRYRLEQQLGRKTIPPPARYGREEALKPKPMDKRLIGYYDL